MEESIQVSILSFLLFSSFFRDKPKETSLLIIEVLALTLTLMLTVLTAALGCQEVPQRCADSAGGEGEGRT